MPQSAPNISRVAVRGDSEGHGRRVCHVPHARSPTVERRAYGRPARGLPSWCCVAGHSDATCAGLTLLAAGERTTDRRAERHPPVRSQQKPTLGRWAARPAGAGNVSFRPVVGSCIFSWRRVHATFWDHTAHRLDGLWP
jgi:hypothetical protein